MSTNLSLKKQLKHFYDITNKFIIIIIDYHKFIIIVIMVVMNDKDLFYALDSRLE